mgnify:CR=1 FL=1
MSLPIDVFTAGLSDSQALGDLEGVTYYKLELVVKFVHDGNYYDGIYCSWAEWDKSEAGRLIQLGAIIDFQAEQLAKLAGQVNDYKDQNRHLRNERAALAQQLAIATEDQRLLTTQADEVIGLRAALAEAQAELKSYMSQLGQAKLSNANLKAIYANGHRAEP